MFLPFHVFFNFALEETKHKGRLTRLSV